MSNPIQLAVIVTSLATKVDGSIAIRLETRELNPKDSAMLFELRGAEAWAVIAPSEISARDIPQDSPDPGIVQKSPQKLFRDRLFIYYTKALNQDPVGFDEWYRRHLDTLGRKYLDKVPEDSA